MSTASQPEMPAPLPAAQPERWPVGSLGAVRVALLVLGATASFHLAFLFAPLCWLVLAYLGCLFELRRVPTARQAFYLGLLVGLGVFVPETGFLWGIFGPAAVPLWLILALFHALFLLLLHRVEVRFGTRWAVWLAPVLWCGIEYFRSEVWWLRFTWFTAGSTVLTLFPLYFFGVYGTGLLTMGAVASFTLALRTWKTGRLVRVFLVGGALIYGLGNVVATLLIYPRAPRQVSGVQLEFPGPPEVLAALDRVVKAAPESQLIMLSEYTFDGPVPDSVKAWCQRNRKWLVVGGKESIASSQGPNSSEGTAAYKLLHQFKPSASTERYYNTAFVISTNGEVVFKQAKSVPIQFFKDGEPAREQRVWDSPWGKLGIAICYDLSYRQVMDELVMQDALGLLIPTMDVEQWGEHEHRLNARMARIRALEYGLPIFRVASSGISQLVDGFGTETATASYPGSGEIITGGIGLQRHALKVPLDHWLAPICTVGTGFVVVGLMVVAGRDRTLRKGRG